ncbi:DUF2007 domain-containing protein [uncultured Cocleimonas sp.]|uniref:putative signal transducing protein n=1 Tax=uncultured Cocleimonas sp. TaxID=1051587 RepID=UPI0026062AB1|nr:DUF2007 domain-containing protein [uncultured Cocleimonas sp.]
MKLVHTSADVVYLHHLKNILEAEGIDCMMKNDRLSSLAGELPLLVCWPELWVKDSLKEAWAKEIIEQALQPTNAEENWVCKNCGEQHSSRFTDCWNCQSIKAF